MGITVGELVAYLDLDANPFTKNLDRAMRDGEAAGKRMDQVGGKLTRNVTLPLLGAGVAALKLGTDFDTAFARAVGLAGVAADEVDGLKDSVLDLAGKTAVAPQELAEALYFASSAGLDTAGAMKAVEVAAKGSAAGLGSAQDIVGLAASAVASYGEANMDAAKATDILTATVKAGRADPAEMAAGLGGLLPIAAKLGVSFGEVGGAVAFLSNRFGDTGRTMTAMKGVLEKLLTPSDQGKKALEDMGTSAEELQASIDQDGLMGALDLLREKGFVGNQDALRSLFDDIEGFQGAIALLNDESGSLAETLGLTTDATGLLDDAYKAAGTDGQTMKQALVDLQIAAIKAGEVIAPFAATTSKGVSAVADAFTALPGPAQGVIIAMAGIMASVGPLMTVGGKIATNWGHISSAFETVRLKSMYAGDAFDRLVASQNSMPWGKIGVAGGVAAAGIGIFALAMFKAQQRSDALRQAAHELADEAERTGKSLEAVALEKLAREFADSDQVTRSMDALGVSFSDLRAPLQGSAKDFEAWHDAMFAADMAMNGSDRSASVLTGRVKGLRDQLGEAEQVTGRTAEAQEALGIESDKAAGGVDDLTGATEEQIPVVQQLAEAYDALLTAVMAQFDADIAYRRSLDSTEDALAGLAEAQNEHGTRSEEYQRALLDVEDAMLGQAAAAAELAVKQAEATGTVLTADEKNRIYREELDRLRGTLEPGSPLFDALSGHIAQLDAIPGTVNTVVTADMTPAQRAMDEFLSRSYVAHVKILANNPQGGGLGLQVHDAGGPVLGPKGSPQLSIVHGGEVVLPTHRMGLGDALQQTLGITSENRSISGGGQIIEHLEMNLQTQDSPQRWFDEGLWQAATGGGL